MAAYEKDAQGGVWLSRLMGWFNGTNAVPVSATNPLPVSLASGGGTARTAALSALTTSAGSVAAGAKSATFINKGTTDATVAGGPLSPGASVTFAVDGADTLAAIAYTASATAILQIATVV
jgi:hypothetical protein